MTYCHKVYSFRTVRTVRYIPSPVIEGSRTPARRKGGDTTAAFWESLRRVDASDLSPKPAGDQFFREPIQEQLDAEAKGRGWYFAAGLSRDVGLLGSDSLVIFASQTAEEIGERL